MAGNYVKILNPGYSQLFTRDIKYTPNTDAGEAATLNVFNPNSANPLEEGEWLEITNPSTPRVTRGGSAAPSGTTAGSKNKEAVTDIGLSEKSCYMNFGEKGRLDQQQTKKAHTIHGPSGFTFTTKMCVAPANTAIGAAVCVGWIMLPNGEYKRGLVTRTIDLDGNTDVWVVGTVERVIAENHIEVKYNPQYAAITA